MKVKEESEKVGLELNIQKTNMATGPIILWQIDGKNNGNSDRLYIFGLQNHVTIAMKLKDACSLEEKLWES